MAIQRTALDLRNPCFRSAFGGVDPADVDALLELAAESYEAVYAELERLRVRHAEASRLLKEMYEGERAVSRVVIEAEEAAGAIRNAAESEIRRILTEAEMRSLAITEPVEEAREALAREIEAVRGRHERAARVLDAAIGELEGKGRTPEDSSTEAFPVAKDAAPVTDASPAGAPPGASSAGMEPAAISAPAVPPVMDAPAVWVERALLTARREEGRSAELTADGSTEVIVQSQEVAARSEEPPSQNLEEAANPAPAAADTRTPEERLRELIAAQSPSARDAGRPDAQDDTATPGTGASWHAEERWAGIGQDAGDAQGIGSSRRPWLLATAAAAVLAIGAAAGLPRLTGLLDATSTGSTLVAGERMDVPVLAASALPSGPPAHTSIRKAAPPARSERPSPLQLRLTASRECWVRITADGKAEERILAPGQAILRAAEREIAVRVGDAGALAAELNGESLPPLGRDGQVVNRVFRPSER